MTVPRFALKFVVLDSLTFFSITTITTIWNRILKARRDSQSGEILNWCSSTVFCKVSVLKVQLYPYLDDGEMGRELHMMVDEILGVGVDPEWRLKHFLRRYEIGFVDDAVRAVCKSKHSFRPRIVPIELCWRANYGDAVIDYFLVQRRDFVWRGSSRWSRRIVYQSKMKLDSAEILGRLYFVEVSILVAAESQST